VLSPVPLPPNPWTATAVTPPTLTGWDGGWTSSEAPGPRAMSSLFVDGRARQGSEVKNHVLLCRECNGAGWESKTGAVVFIDHRKNISVKERVDCRLACVLVV